MKILYFCILVFFCAQHRLSNGAVVRKQPTFSKPIYSNSYLPAAMQVIFHAVGQLKSLQTEENEDATTTTTMIPATSPHLPGQHQPLPQQSATSSSMENSGDSTQSEVTTVSIESVKASTVTPISFETSDRDLSTSPPSLMALNEVLTSSTSLLAFNDVSTTLIASSSASVEMSTTSTQVNDAQSDVINQEYVKSTSDDKGPKIQADVIDAETPEENYATPEMNHEIEESVQEIEESVHEITELNEETPENYGDYSTSFPSSGDSFDDFNAQATTVVSKNEDNSEEHLSAGNKDDKKSSGESENSSSENSKTEKKSSEESKDGEDSSEESKDDKDSSEESKDDKDSSEESKEDKDSSEESKDESDESKHSSKSQQKNLDIPEDEDEEIRFTMIGEKVSQVPRPSLSSYLRKTIKRPLGSSVEELAALYDALSKDARRQGLAKYSGYSDEVLKTLESSAEGGIVPQLCTLLQKTLERKEVTRDDAKLKLSSTLKKLNDPSSTLTADLRRLIPLRYLS